MVILLNFTDVPVWKVTPNTPDAISITEGKVNNAVFNLKVDINGAASTVKGEGLWKASAWASHRPDGEGERISYTEQVKKLTKISDSRRRNQKN